MSDEQKDKGNFPFGLQAANESFSKRLGVALKGVRFYQQQSGDGRDKLEIIVDLMRGEKGATVADVIEITGWPVEIVSSTLATLAGLVEGGEISTLVNAGGTHHIYRIRGWDEDEPSEI